jgi:hypothetical protein
MNRFAIVFASAAMLGTLVPGIRADVWNKKTVLTVNEPIQVPNKVLEPGQYVMKLMDSPSNRHIVQVFDNTEQHLITTVLALPAYRVRPTDKTVFTYWEAPPGQPKALRTWFYPGDNFGQEFPQPKLIAASLTTASYTPAPTAQVQNESSEPPAISEQTGQVEEKSTAQEEPQEIAQATPPPPPAPAPEPQATTKAPAPEPPESLPHTASGIPLIGLVGLLSLAGYAVLRVQRSS